MRTRTIILLVSTVIAVFAIAPSMSFAADATPDEMVDPASAMQPELSDDVEATAAPAAPAEATATDSDTVTMDGSSLDPDSANSTPGTSSATASVEYSTGSGASLPFTGPEDGRIALLLIVGSLLLAGGATAWSLGRVAQPAR